MKRQLPLELVIAPAILIVAAVGFFLLVKPKMDEGGRLDEQIAEFQTKVDTALAAEHTPKPGETIEVADVFRLTKALPEQTDMPSLLLELNAVAEAAGVDFLSIAPQAPVTREAGYQAVPIALSFEGYYYDLTDFLFRLRNLVIVRDGELEAEGRLFTLDSFDLHEGTEGFPHVSATLTLSAYTFSAEQAAAAAAATTPPATATTAEDPAASLGTE